MLNEVAIVVHEVTVETTEAFRCAVMQRHEIVHERHDPRLRPGALQRLDHIDNHLRPRSRDEDSIPDIRLLQPRRSFVPGANIPLGHGGIQEPHEEPDHACATEMRAEPALPHIFRNLEFDATVGGSRPLDFVKRLLTEGEDDEMHVRVEQGRLARCLDHDAGNSVILHPLGGRRKQGFGEVVVDGHSRRHVELSGCLSPTRVSLASA